MAETTYEYSKATMPKLDQIGPDIDDSSMSQSGKDAYSHASYKSDNTTLYVTFTDALIPADKTILDSIVAALPDDTPEYLWDVIPLPITMWARIGANQPALAQMGVEVCYKFDDSTSEECWVSIPRPEGWDGQSDMKLIVWAQNDEDQTGDKAARLSLRYATQRNGDQYVPSTSPVTVRADNFDWVTDAPQKKFRRCFLTLPYDDADNPLSKKQIMMKLMRIANHAGDTMEGDLCITMAVLRYKRTALGDPEND